MTFLRKAIAAAAAAAIAVSISMSAFANNITTPDKPIDSVNNEVSGNYMYFEFGAGYAKTINKTDTLRDAYAQVEVIYNQTGITVTSDYKENNIDFNQYVKASVSSLSYPTSIYHFQCRGGIHVGASPQTPVVEYKDMRYPI